MNVLIDRVAGLDVHQATVVATVRIPGEGGRRTVTETFGTMTPDLWALREWLHAYGVTHVALESTGVYWKPVYYVLEDAFTLLLINMQELKRVPGRKTDVRDSDWLAQLLECGLLRPSFVPPPAIRELRDLTRYRVQQVRDRAQEVNRLYKVLEDSGLKLTSVITDVMGVSGRAMLDALVAGTTDPQVLADLARGRLRQKLPALQRALQGRFRGHHALLIPKAWPKSTISTRPSRGSRSRSTNKDTTNTKMFDGPLKAAPRGEEATNTSRSPRSPQRLAFVASSPRVSACCARRPSNIVSGSSPPQCSWCSRWRIPS